VLRKNGMVSQNTKEEQQGGTQQCFECLSRYTEGEMRLFLTNKEKESRFFTKKRWRDLPKISSSLTRRNLCKWYGGPKRIVSSWKWASCSWKHLNKVGDIRQPRWQFLLIISRYHVNSCLLVDRFNSISEDLFFLWWMKFTTPTQNLPLLRILFVLMSWDALVSDPTCYHVWSMSSWTCRAFYSI